MNPLEQHRVRFTEALDGTRCFGSDQQPIELGASLLWLADRTRERRKDSGSIFFIGVGAGDPQSHHFAAAFYRRARVRGIALGESPFRTALGDGARAAETLAQWFAKPGDLVVHLLDSTPSDRARAILAGASSLGLRTVAFLRPDQSKGTEIPGTSHLSFLIPSNDDSVCDSVQHFVVNAWITALQGEG